MLLVVQVRTLNNTVVCKFDAEINASTWFRHEEEKSLMEDEKLQGTKGRGDVPKKKSVTLINDQTNDCSNRVY